MPNIIKNQQENQYKKSNERKKEIAEAIKLQKEKYQKKSPQQYKTPSIALILRSKDFNAEQTKLRLIDYNKNNNLILRDISCLFYFNNEKEFKKFHEIIKKVCSNPYINMLFVTEETIEKEVIGLYKIGG